jgi:hypothetical protein
MVEPIAIATGLKAGEVLGEARNSDEMLAIWRATRERIGLSNAHCDELANFADGQVDKILGPTGVKSFGPKTFTGLNWMFAVKWICVVDAEQLAIMSEYWKDRQRQVSHVRPTPSRVSKAILERAKPKLLKEFGEKLALAFGDDIDQLLLGMKPDRLAGDEKGIAPADTLRGPQETIIISEPVAAIEQADSPYAAHGPVSPPPPVSRAHLRVIQSKRGSKYGHG